MFIFSPHRMLLLPPHTHTIKSLLIHHLIWYTYNPTSHPRKKNKLNILANQLTTRHGVYTCVYHNSHYVTLVTESCFLQQLDCFKHNVQFISNINKFKGPKSLLTSFICLKFVVFFLRFIYCLIFSKNVSFLAV